jgi:hypothetical protein
LASAILIVTLIAAAVWIMAEFERDDAAGRSDEFADAALSAFGG